MILLTLARPADGEQLVKRGGILFSLTVLVGRGFAFNPLSGEKAALVQVEEVAIFLTCGQCSRQRLQGNKAKNIGDRAGQGS